MAQAVGFEGLARVIKVEEMDKKNMTENFISHFKNMWADNGDYISKVYAGTGATTSSTTRKGKGGIMGMLDHKMKSIERFYKGHYIDNDK